MISKFFEKSDILRFIGILFLLLLLFGKSFNLSPNEESLSYIHFFLFKDAPLWNLLLSLFLILLQGIVLFIVSNQFRLIKNDSLLVTASYILLMAFFPELLHFPELYLLQIFFSISIYFLFYTSIRDFHYEILFWASFIIGILSLFEFAAILLLPLSIIFLGIIKKLNFRNLFILSFGFSLAYLLLISYHFLLDTSFPDVPVFREDITFHFDKIASSHKSFILLVIILFASFRTFNNIARQLVLQKQLFLFLSILSLVYILFAFQSNPHFYFFSILPASFLVGKTIEISRSNLWKDLYFLTLFLFALFQNIFELNFL